MKIVYIISGLGADRRVFHRLDLCGLDVIFIDWIIPDNHETLEQYASRLRVQITSENPIIIGLSFGGILALEISKQIETDKVILISSAKTKNEIPFYYRLGGYLGLHKFMPVKLLKTLNFVTHWIFGVNTFTDKELLNQIIQDTNPKFLKWAIDKIVKWSNATRLNNLVHIHGSNDRILPIRNITCDTIIKDGGHLMVLNKAEEVSKRIRNLLM